MKKITRKIMVALSIAIVGLALINTTSCFFDANYHGRNGLFLDVDFDRNNSHEITGNNITKGKDELLSKWNEKQLRPTGVLEDNHGRVCQLHLLDWKDVYAETNVNLKKDGVLTFEFKSDAFQEKDKPGVLELRITDERDPNNPDIISIRHNGRGDGWCKTSVPISRGKKKIRWIVPIRRFSSGESVIYLDNITIAPNTIDEVVIYPKGLQETYVGGNSIKFTAIPFRCDNSVISNQNVTYSVSNGGLIGNNGIFVPEKEGKYTITARIGNKTAYKTDVYVHGKNYLSESVEIGNYTFTGKVELKPQIMSERIISNLDTRNVKYDYSVTPMDVNFNADGFFILKGKTIVPLYIEVVKKDNPNLKTNFLIRDTGDFYKRIWLRFGSGDYSVRIIEDSNMQFCNATSFAPTDKVYEGELYSANTTNNRLYTNLNVTNTNPITEREAKYLLPSEAVQSDSFEISNIANFILEDLGSRRTDGNILRAIHDFVIHSLHADITSLKYPQYSKRQDAVHAVNYGMALPDGYANLFAAIARKCGFKTRITQGFVTKYDINKDYVTDGQHTWNNVYYNGAYYIVDTALDDPYPSKPSLDYKDKRIMSEDYSYFMTPNTYEAHKELGNDSLRNINNTNLSNNLY